MKCLITGHTTGIGKALYDSFVLKGFDVVGVSRTTGYDISERYQDIIALAETCDLFINNAYCQDYQTRLLKDLAGKTKIISIGSIAGYYANSVLKKKEYCLNKSQLITETQRLSFHHNVLVINVSLTENSSSDPGCTYNDIINVCNYWLDNTNFSVIDFSVKLSKTNLKLIEDDFGLTLKDFL
jgi:NAD(P)-dependent dehydrogenase (short-subunit alcohol dehydrogenase family)